MLNKHTLSGLVLKKIQFLSKVLLFYYFCVNVWLKNPLECLSQKRLSILEGSFFDNKDCVFFMLKDFSNFNFATATEFTEIDMKLSRNRAVFRPFRHQNRPNFVPFGTSCTTIIQNIHLVIKYLYTIFINLSQNHPQRC